MNREQARQTVYDRFRDELRPDGKRRGYVCPICGSGTGPKGTGISENKNSPGHYTCWAGCFTSADAFDILAQKEGLPVGSAEAMKAAYDRYGIVIDSAEARTSPQERQKAAGVYNTPPKREKPPERRTGAADANYVQYYRECAARLASSPEALAYLHGRGLDDETIKHFMLGYAPDWKNPGGRIGTGTPRIIVPLHAGGYLARALREGDEAQKIHVGRKQPFNIAALNDKTGAPGEDADNIVPPIICEGPFDAMALYQGGYKASIALCGTDAKELIKEAQKKAPDAVFVLALDNDDPGRRAQEKARAELEAAGFAIICADQKALYGPHKDAGEAARQGHSELWDELARAACEAYEAREQRESEREQALYNQTGAGMVDSFLQEIRTERYKPISTGFSDFDKLIGGGLMRQTITFVGAPPGTGKTVLCSMIFENLAKSGTRCIYLNLEMSRNQLLARSFSRIIYRYTGKQLSSTDILQGYKHTPEESAQIEKAASLYKSTYAENLLYNPEGLTGNLDAILEYIEKEAVRAEASGEAAPAVCVDYLQLIAGTEREDAATTIKRAVNAFKGYAIAHNAIVVCIMAQSRSANRADEATQAAGRDSSAIEYGADLQIQLKADEKTDSAQKRVTLFATKNRFGLASLTHGTEFVFNGAAATFIQIDTRHTAP